MNEATKNEAAKAVSVIAVGDTASGVIAEVSKSPGNIRIVRRCPELAELLAACQNGLAQAAVVAEGSGELSATLVDRLAAVGVTVVAVAATPEEAQRLHDLGASPVTEQVTPERLGQVVIAAVQSRRQLDAAGYAVPTLPIGSSAPGLNPFQDNYDGASPVSAAAGSTVGSAAADVESSGAGDGPTHLSRRAARGAKRLAAKHMRPKVHSEKDRQAPPPASEEASPEELDPDALATDTVASDTEAPDGVAPGRVDPEGLVPMAQDPARTAADETVGGGFAEWPDADEVETHKNPDSPDNPDSADSPSRESSVHDRTTSLWGRARQRFQHSGQKPSQFASRPAAAVRPERSTLVALWGPIGSPGRTTVAINLAAEQAAAGRSVMVIDADSYGASIAAALGLLEESASFAQACRVADQGALSAAQFSAIATKVVFSGGTFSLLTGLTRADRWPELRAAAVVRVLKLARESAQLVVVDCGFSLENDEELSYDTVAPRRNGATLAVLAEADIIYAVGSGDPVGIPRLIRGMHELAQSFPGAHVEVVVNKVRRKVAGRAPEKALAQAWERFGPAQPISHFLPWDPDLSDKALLEGKLLLEIAPDAPLRKSIRGIRCAAVQQNAEVAVSSATAEPQDRG